jgi:uncharacterized protein (TIRG00374 family)
LLKHWRLLALGLIVSAGAVYMIFSQSDPQLLGEALHAAFTPRGLLWFLLASLIAVIGLLMRAVRWRVLLNGGLPLVRAFHILNIAYLVNGVVPLRIGELARIWLASRPSPQGDNGVPVLKSASTIIVERLLDLLTVVVLIAIGLLVAGDQVPDSLRATGGVMGLIAVSGFLTLVMLSRQRQLAHRLLNFVTSRVKVLGRLNLSRWLDDFLDGLLPLAHFGSLINALLWTSISWLLSFISGYMLMLIFYDQGDVVATLLYIAAASFAVAVPATVGNLGPYELSILLVLTGLGYTQTPQAEATATVFAFTVHFMNLLVNAILGVIGFLAEGVSISQVSQGAQTVRDAAQS